MGEVTKLLYIVVVDEGENGKKGKESFQYSCPVLQSTLQLMGCKARHAFKISRRVFELMKTEFSVDAWLSTGVEILELDASNGQFQNENTRFNSCCAEKIIEGKHVILEKDEKCKSKPFESYQRRTTVVVRRKTFLDVVCDALAEYKHVGPNQKADLLLACRIRERKESVTVLLCGTSGCGKSTLSSLLASRLGITTIISTDSIRHMMRSFVDEKQNPLLWSSTYHAGECLDPEAVATAKAQRKAKKLAGVSKLMSKEDVSHGSEVGNSDSQSPEMGPHSSKLTKQMAIGGFKAQSEMVIDSLDRLISSWEERKESVVVEGVHLSLNFVMGLMKKHPSTIPFMIYISDEDNHLERFAVRAKYMTLDPAKNKYVKYIRNIRAIQEYLCQRADKHLVPKINNTNVDKSVAAIHATVFGCLRRRDGREQIYDPATNTVRVVNEEYTNQCTANSLSNECMLQLIQRKGSTRHLMALLNMDGSVAKAWPVDRSGKPVLGKSTEKGAGTQMYGPMKIAKSEPINLQFGHFGISAWWASDSCGTSHTSSVDGSRGEVTDNGSRYYSSCCSSMSDGPAKKLKEEHSVHGSDEEVDDPPEVDSNDDISDDAQNENPEEMEGSVYEGSTKSDEEYDDLAMQDIQENGYQSDGEFKKKEIMPTPWQEPSYEVPRIYKDNHRQSLDHFSRTKGELSELPCSYSFLAREKTEKIVPCFGNVKLRKRSQSILAFGKHGSAENLV